MGVMGDLLIAAAITLVVLILGLRWYFRNYERY
jgi:hypothetical protein